MPANVQGTFTNLGQISAVMDENQGTFKLTATGLDASNTVKTQKSTDNGSSWTDVTTYNSDQASTVITPGSNEQFRLTSVLLQVASNKQIAYKLSRES